MNKYEFIKELLVEKKITQNQRDRILELASKEIGYEGTLDERISKIEEIVYNQNKVPKIPKYDEQYSPQESELPQYINPSDLYKFLFEYNQNDILRTTCHDIDSNELDRINEFCKTEKYNFQIHLSNIIEEFKKHEKKYYGGGKVNALIRAYLTGKNFDGKDSKFGWTEDQIKINWSSTELLNWANNNPGIPPNFNQSYIGKQEIEPFRIEPQLNSSITYEPIQNFTQLVLHFKNLFHIKHGKQSLREIISRVNSEKNWNEYVTFEISDPDFPYNLEHFTNVEKLVQAYNKIIQLIIEQNNSNADPPIVKLSFKEKDKVVFFSIHHLNGQYNKTIQNTVDRIGQTYSSLIKNQINGLCNLSLKADFGNNLYAEINLWDGKNRKSKNIENFQGVEHILIFPKDYKK